MSNNPTPPRIEREAVDQYPAMGTNIVSRSLANTKRRAYVTGATNEFNRAAPVVKALEEVLEGLGDLFVEGYRNQLKQILETYKADL